MSDCTIRTWLAEPMSDEVKQAIQRLGRCADALHIAVMPDVHLAEQVCVGVAFATSGTIYPDAVGGDIGCGMATIALHADADVLRRESAAVAMLEALRRHVPVNRRHVPLAHAPDPTALSDPSLVKLGQRDGRVQFGTLGRGNLLSSSRPMRNRVCGCSSTAVLARWDRPSGSFTRALPAG